jgi:hypothetical protein
MQSLNELNGRTERVGEALAATAYVGRSKVFFKFGGNVGTITWDLTRDKWYGSLRLIPQVKKAFEIK